jgi:hypothetical protein
VLRRSELHGEDLGETQMGRFNSRKRKFLAVLLVALVAVIVAGLAENQGTSSSKGTEETNGPASFIGHASNAVVFIQWTRSGRTVTGSLREAITKRLAGSGVTSDDHAFTGVVDGKGLTLNIQGGESTAYVGEIENSGFRLTVPGKGSSLITINFEPGEVASYDSAEKELLLSEYSSPCSLYVTGHEVRVAFNGAAAAEECASLVQKMPSTEWTTEAQQAANSSELPIVCELTNRTNEHAVVTDGGGQEYGHQTCNQLSGEGWG